MKYRREIDGLRALAVVPVILFHAGFQLVSGGYVGVDIFFVISGYLITSIILHELQKDRLSLLYFYERRARRILPALFVVMAVSSIFAYAWMLPDDLKGFGQSVLATTLFSNNILLALTSGYWSLQSEFKPLLHTWSLGVEEQYYVIFPLLMMLGWKYFRGKLVWVLSFTALLSLIIANWGAFNSPDLTFYLLPTRAWEILLGSLVAFYLNTEKSTDIQIECNPLRKEVFSFIGFSLIVISIFIFDHNQPSPSFYTLIPTLGAVLIILFATEGTVVGKLLSSRVMVGLGLISYSSYLWHQPLISFNRIYSKTPPSITTMTILVGLTFLLAYITWKFVETPFRNRVMISRNVIVISATILSIIFVMIGYYFHKSYGVPSRIYDDTVKIEDINKQIYNERVFKFNANKFSSDKKLKILVLGNSFARDFINMNIETFDLKNIEIVYRDNLPECILPFKSDIAKSLYGSAEVIVFASGKSDPTCVQDNIVFSQKNGNDIFYIGTKNFGYNLNWISRLNFGEHQNLYNQLPIQYIAEEKMLSALIPSRNYISLMSRIVKDGQIPITDELGRPISSDRGHLTKYGAEFLGEKALLSSRYGQLLNQHKTLSD